MAWGSPEEVERRRRIFVAAYAYAYEVESRPLVDDATYDAEAALVDPFASTGNEVLDWFFLNEFEAYTGAWVHKHPEKDKLKRIVAIMRQSRGG